MGRQWKQGQTLFSWYFLIFFDFSKITADGDFSHEIKTLAPWKNSYDQPRQHIKKQRYYFPNKSPSSKAMVFPVVMCRELDHKEGWVLKNRYFQTVVLEKTLESSLNCKDIKLVNPEGNKIFIEGLMLKLKLQYFDHLMWRANSLEKTLMVGNIEHKRERRCQRMR